MKNKPVVRGDVQMVRLARGPSGSTQAKTTQSEHTGSHVWNHWHNCERQVPQKQHQQVAVGPRRNRYSKNKRGSRICCCGSIFVFHVLFHVSFVLSCIVLNCYLPFCLSGMTSFIFLSCVENDNTKEHERTNGRQIC